MTAVPRLAQYVQPSLPEERIARQWAKINDAAPRAGRLRVGLVPALAFSLCIGVVATIGLFFWHRPNPINALNGTIAETTASGSEALTLPDGSRIELAEASRMVVDEYAPTHVQLTLRQGQARLQVAHNPHRRFTVLAADYEVSVIGTRFSVILGQSPGSPRVTVQVEQGKVSVRNRNPPYDERILSAHETWTDGTASGEAANSPDTTASATADDPSADASSLTPQTTPALASTRWKEVLHAQGPAAAFNALGPGGLAGAVANAGPKDLFELAELARINGKLRDCSNALNKLRRNFRSDSRAGLAAFELGRLRVDSFGDLSGGADALRDAIQLSPNAPFREDAQARLVQLYQRQGQMDQCRSAKQAYLARYPNGAASKVISQSCDH